MKHALILPLLLLAACPTTRNYTPEETARRSYYAALGGYTEAVQQVTLWASMPNGLDLDAAEKFEELRVPADLAIKTMKRELAAGNYSAVGTAAKVVDDLLLWYSLQLAKKENR